MTFPTRNVILCIQEFLVQITKLLSVVSARANKLFLTGNLVG